MGRDSYMKGAGILVISLRVEKCSFCWLVSLRVESSAIILPIEVTIKGVLLANQLEFLSLDIKMDLLQIGSGKMPCTFMQIEGYTSVKVVNATFAYLVTPLVCKCGIYHLCTNLCLSLHKFAYEQIC